MELLIHAHSGLRYLILVLLLGAIILAALPGETGKTSKQVIFFAMLFLHLQVILGFILYVISPKIVFSDVTMVNPMYRFYTVEHLVGMLLAVTFITIGYGRYKRESNTKKRKILVYYSIGLIIILVSIPWPFRNLGGNWF